MPQLPGQLPTQPAALGPTQTSLICGLANIKDQVECPGRGGGRHILSLILKQSTKGLGPILVVGGWNNIFSLTAEGLTLWICTCNHKKLYLVTHIMPSPCSSGKQPSKFACCTNILERQSRRKGRQCLCSQEMQKCEKPVENCLWVL